MGGLIWERDCPGRRGPKVSLLCCLLIEYVSQFRLTFTLLPLPLENGECHTVSGRQSSKVLEHLLFFIGSFSDLAESVIL